LVCKGKYKILFLQIFEEKILKFCSKNLFLAISTHFRGKSGANISILFIMRNREGRILAFFLLSAPTPYIYRYKISLSASQGCEAKRRRQCTHLCTLHHQSPNDTSCNALAIKMLIYAK